MGDVPFIKKNLALLKELEGTSEEKSLEVYSCLVREAYDYLSTKNIRAMDETDYLAFKSYVDDLVFFIRKSSILSQEKYRLHNQIGAIKVGARVPFNFFEENSKIRDFFRINDLENVFWALKLTAGYDIDGGALLPVESKEMETSWHYWSELQWKKTESGYQVFSTKGLLFKTDDYKMFTRAYSVLWHGITFYDRRRSPDFRPYKYQDPKTYGNQNLLEVVVTWRKGEDFSYLASTHVSMELKGDDGSVRSFGQDIYDHIREIPMRGFFRATSRCSILKTPDEASFYPKNFRVTKKITIPLTKKEHAKVIQIVEEDKANCKHSAALLKGNCVSYTCSIFQRVFNYTVHSDVSGHEILLREFLPKKFDKIVHSLLAKAGTLPSPLQKGLFFMPPLSIVIVIIGLWSFCSSYFGHNNHREYPLWEYLFKPWNIRADIPKLFFDVLDKYTDENGYIDRSKFPNGWVFD